MISSKKYKKKLVICLSRFPFPLEKGDKLRAYFQLRDLSEFADIYLICTTTNKIEEKHKIEIEKFCKEVHIFKLNKVVQAINLCLAFISVSKIPFQVTYFTQSALKKKINQLLAKIKPDHIFCQLIRPAEYVKNYHYCPKSIDLMDALSMGMERRSQNSNWILSLIFREESNRLKKYERQILNYFEHLFIISQQDKEFILHPKQKEILVLPNGVNELFLTNDKENIKKDIDILFTGNMSYFPNIEATKYIHNALYATLKQHRLKTVICGANPSTNIKKLHQDDFKITGWVEDIKVYYQKARLFVAPMFSGSGMQNKILEAMAMGVPCITTSLANNAILAEPNVQILIANNKEEFMKCINDCLSNKDLYRDLSLNGKKFVQEKFNWKEINKQLAKIILEENF